MKILVTGATGFVGSNVIEYLLAHHPGHEIIATARNASKAKEQPWISKVQFEAFDYHNIDSGRDLFTHFGKPDVMIHLAWSFLPQFKLQDHVTTELPAQKILLENLITNGLKNLTCVGTCYEYGLQDGRLSESAPAKPVVPYAEAKLQLLNHLSAFKKSQPFNLTWVRLFFMYGKGQSSKSIIPQLDRAIENGEKVFNMSKGDQERDYLRIDKVAEKIVKLSLLKGDHGVVNCTSGHAITVRKLVEDHLAKRNYNMELNLGFYPYPDYEPFSFWGDDTKLRKLISS
jgi:nucleoside-diphosphate-sugar epimerase